jgi:hypothetical protein
MNIPSILTVLPRPSLPVNIVGRLLQGRGREPVQYAHVVIGLNVPSKMEFWPPRRQDRITPCLTNKAEQQDRHVLIAREELGSHLLL